jgi:UDP-glucose 4-epimerase
VDPARVRPPRSEVATLVSDPGRARARLGWIPETGLEEGVRRTAAWLGPRLAGRDVARYQL